MPTTQPEDIAAYAQRVGDAWKIGRREVGDGLLIVVAKNDRRVNIQTAKALEGAVPDLAARQIIDNAIRPAFRADDYAGGLNAAVDQLIARIKGEALPEPSRSASRSGPLGGLQPMELLIFAFVALPVVAGVTRRIFGRGLGSLASAGATGVVAWLVSSSLIIAVIGGVIGLLFGLFAGASNLLRSSGRGHGGFGGGFGGGGGLEWWRWRRLFVGRGRQLRRRWGLGQLVKMIPDAQARSLAAVAAHAVPRVARLVAWQ